MRRASPTRIGLFVIGGIALLVAAIVTVTGGGLFASKERAVMHFEGSIYGLQLGAPVVFRGVRLGSVVDIGVVHDGRSGGFEIPVVAELDRNLIQDMHGRPVGQQAGLSLSALVKQGLTAQLSTQSLLTGLLYVDLDLRPGVSTNHRPAAGAGALVEIPTVTAPFQLIRRRIEQLDVETLMADVTAIAASARRLLGDSRVEQALADLASTSAELKQLVARMNQRVDPLSQTAHKTLTDAERTFARLDSAADRVGSAADKVAGLSDKAAALAERAGPVLDQGAQALQGVRRAADEMARAAQTLRAVTGEESPLMAHVERAAQDVARASRAVRDLADLLERQPEALLRGRSTAP